MVDASTLIFTILSGSTDVTALVGAVPNCRIFASTIPEKALVPAVVHNTAGGMPENLMTDAPPLDHERRQVDCYALDPVTANALYTSVRAALENPDNMPIGVSIKCVSFNAVPGFEADTKRYRKSFDWSFITGR